MCVRKYLSQSNIFSSFPHSNECEQDCEGEDLGYKKVTLDESAIHTFTSCSWKDCSDSLGGAISFREKTESSLTVNKCTFDSCTSSFSAGWSNGGGAINCYSVRSVSILSSSFLSCSSLNNGGGGINFYYIIQQPYVTNCDFISCHADDDGGGVAIWSSYANDNTIVCRDCRFIKGTSSGSVDPWAGGIILWGNGNILKCSEILFAYNEAFFGGAYGTDCNVDFPDFPLSFCFFHSNTGAYGNDVCFYLCPSEFETKYFLHCFSTSEGNRVKDYAYIDYSNWIP